MGKRPAVDRERAMRKENNYTAVGAFVVGATLLVGVTLAFFGNRNVLASKLTYVAYFPGSVKGLQIGAPVSFRGVKIGSVTDIRVLVGPEMPNQRIPVYLEIDPERFSDGSGSGLSEVEKQKAVINDISPQRGMRAQLQMQSLVTGQLFVMLDYLPDTPIHLVTNGEPVPEIPTVASGLEQWTEKLESLPLDELVELTLKSMRGVTEVVAGPLPGRILEETLATVIGAKALVEESRRQVKGVGGEMTATLEASRVALQEVTVTVNQLRRTTAHTGEQLDPLLKSAVATLDQARKSMVAVESLTGEGSETRVRFGQAMDQVATAASALRHLADFLEQRPEALWRGRGGE
ncbi:MAG: MCE family protein [Magnetococcales bacterium]|nr:MCE family protein [Magnetococcales bacterium]